MGGPATTGTPYTSITNIKSSFSFCLLYRLHSDIVHCIIKVPSEVRAPGSKEPFKCANKSTVSCSKQKDLFQIYHDKVS